MSATVSTLGELVAPLTEDAFIKLLRERKFVHLRAPDSNRYQSMMSWDRLVGLLERGEYPRGFGEVRVAKESKNVPAHCWQTISKVDNKPRVDTAKVEAFMASGNSLIVMPLQAHIASLAALCDNIRSQLSEEIKVGVVVTTGPCGAFELHFDPEDLIILQLEGTKRWQLFGPPVSNPVVGMPKQGARPTALLFDEVLQPGDFLFLPAGTWHHCQNGPDRSLHLGIFFVPLTGWTVAKSIASQLVSDETFRRPLTRIEDTSERAAFEVELKKRLVEKIDELKLDEFIAKWNKPKKVKPSPPKTRDHKAYNDFIADWNK